ncbi:Receptor protein kinase [Melia azedarach]|uniref:Receptor protein kinase n=1 Tax=Melia azedarach TaxID=155640 RepID=A0ACC1WR66_MELAZ|nr:Receptor protein kinase [Melia azedarach]
MRYNYIAWATSLIKTQKQCSKGYLLAATGFKKFTYGELKKATKGFTEEIGRGVGGVVYRALLSDKRVAAVKLLNEAKQGEAEFLTEVQTIEKLNHMNLIEMWGCCAEGKHRLSVYEYMEHGSLADNLYSNSISWDKSHKTYSWILITKQKWQILGCLIKLQNRGGLNDSSFSRIRGTRGYIAPEWVYNLPITSKVDVYSYGMVTEKSPTTALTKFEIEGVPEHGKLVTWVREKRNGAPTKAVWIEEIVDPRIAGNYDVNRMEIMVKVALQCVEEDRAQDPPLAMWLRFCYLMRKNMPQNFSLAAPYDEILLSYDVKKYCISFSEMRLAMCKYCNIAFYVDVM